MLPANSPAQDFEIGYASVRASDESRDGRVVELLIYYPADSSGQNVPLASSNGKGFPVVSFGHGYRMPARYYQNIWTAIVPAGYVMVLPDSETKMFPSHSDFGLDLVFAIKHMITENSDSSSIFYKRLSTKSCLMGHSMGGGSAILGAAHYSGVNSLAVLSPLDTRPSSAEAAKSVTTPALVITGSNDFITPPRKHALPVFNALASPEKRYISIKGGNHCNMAMKNRLCDFAERTRPGNKISREEQHEILKSYLLPWLDYTLKGYIEARREFESMLETDKSIESLK
ncbi:MAG: alpha/beta hydrolase family protein [Bacteroidota bacterium]